MNEQEHEAHSDNPKQEVEQTAHWPTAEEFQTACSKAFQNFKSWLSEQFPPEPPYPPGRGRRWRNYR